MYPMVRVWLIHNNIPPYRVPLFAEIAKRADFDFSVVLTAAKCKHRPHWKIKAELMPFKVLTMKGLNFARSEDSSVSISLGLFPLLILRRPDVVICSGFSLATLFVFFYTKLLRKKYIIWSESTEITERRRRMNRLRKWSRRVLASNADAFVDAGVNSREYIQSLLLSSSEAPFFRSYNCVDGSLFSSGSVDDSGGKSGPPFQRILFVGRLNRNKGIPMLLEVYRDLLENSGDAIGLVLAGEGPLHEIIEKFQRSYKSASIKMLGQVPYDQMVRYYRECDVFVLLSLSDCNPLVIFEALHAGTPIVCSENAGNARDFIVSGQNGYIVNPEDRDSIVQCISDVLKWDTAKQAECARVSREQVKKANYEDSAAAFIQACEAVFPK